MEARFVYETLDFERGRDPMDTLEIGRYDERQIEKAKILLEPEFQNITKKYGGTFEVDILSEDSHKRFGIKFLWIPAYKKSYKGKTFSIVFEKVDYNFYYIPTVYDSNGYPEVHYNFTENHTEAIRNIIESYHFNLPVEEEEIMESLNFERGKDPKASLNIGIEAQINNIINDEDQLGDLMIEIDQEIGSAMQVYLPLDKQKEIAKLYLSNQYESLPHYEFKVLDQTDDDEPVQDEYGNLIEPRINYEVADLEAEGWEKFYEENNFGTIEVVMIREK